MPQIKFKSGTADSSYRFKFSCDEFWNRKQNLKLNSANRSVNVPQKLIKRFWQHPIKPSMRLFRHTGLLILKKMAFLALGWGTRSIKIISQLCATFAKIYNKPATNLYYQNYFRWASKKHIKAKSFPESVFKKWWRRQKWKLSQVAQSHYKTKLWTKLKYLNLKKTLKFWVVIVVVTTFGEVNVVAAPNEFI